MVTHQVKWDNMKRTKMYFCVATNKWYPVDYKFKY